MQLICIMKKDIICLLQSFGFRATKIRISIISLFKNATTPLDAEMIRNSLTAQHINADMATVYRIIRAFIVKKIIRRIELYEGKYRYELHDLPHHHHIVCIKCKSIADIDVCNIQTKENLITNKKGFVINNHTLEFFGLCQNCQ